MAKWKKAEAGGHANVDIDAHIWCPCDPTDVDEVYLQINDPGVSKIATCSRCGKRYRAVVSIRIEEQEATNG